MRSLIVAASMAVLLSGCGVKNYSPVVDRPGSGYQQDLVECRLLATQRSTGTEAGLVGTAAGGALGAAVGAGFSAIFGGNVGRGAAGGALAGGVSAGIRSAVQARRNQKAIVVKCLQYRGHRIVGY